MVITIPKYNALDWPPYQNLYVNEQGSVNQDRIQTAPYSKAGCIEIRCNCRGFVAPRAGHAAWCEHAQYAVDTDRDVLGEYLDDPSGRDAMPLVGIVKVVLLGIPNVTIFVECIPVMSEPQMSEGLTGTLQRLDLILMDRFLDRLSTEPFGVISPREGRRAITQVFFDWLADQCDNKFECEAKWHGGESVFDFSDLPDNFQVPALADAVDILTSHQCRRCNEQEVPSLEQNPKAEAVFRNRPASKSK